MRTPNFRAGLPLVGLLAVGVLVGCSSVSDVTRERVARSETSVQQAQQAVGRSEAGALELQRAKDNLEQAKAALSKKESAEGRALCAARAARFRAGCIEVTKRAGP